jgi:serine/threonine protein phosphatase PrpC
MECPHCQTANREGAHFCMNCGRPLPAAADLPAGARPSLAATDAAGSSAETASEPAAVTDDQAASTAPTGAEPAAARTPDLLAPSDFGDAFPASAEQPVAQDEASATQPDQDDGLPTGPDSAVASEPPTNAPTPLAAGEMIAGRFQIVELLTTEAEANLYRTYDLAICPACGEEAPTTDEAFCPQCGAERETVGAPVARLLHEAWSPEALGAREQDGVWQGGRFYLPAARADAPTPDEGAPNAAPAGMILRVGYASDTGRVRELDEDSIGVITLAGVYEGMTTPALGLFIVADGMGGHEGGEVASRLAVQIIGEWLTSRVLLPAFAGAGLPASEAARAQVVDAIQEANGRIWRLAQERGNDMGCTLTLALVLGPQAYIANVGDSRTYVWGRAGLRQATVDHSVIASLIAAGLARPEELYTHPERSVIYRALGVAETVEVDVWEEQLQPGEGLLLCCDGVWEALRDEGIADVLGMEGEPQAACAEIIRRANLAGGEDNLSVILVKEEAR